MDFGVSDGLVPSENNNNNSSLISCCDLDLKPKWFGSGGGFCKQEVSVSASASAATHQDEWRDLKMAKIGEDDICKTMLLQQQQQQQQRSNGTSVYSDAQNMFSFSSPNTDTVTFPYYAATSYTGYGVGGPFTASQWMELEHQALIYKYITANAAIPSNLLIPIRKALQTAAFSAYSGRHNSFGWGGLHLGFCNNSDPEPGRCRRTDGKKWRCAKDAVPDQKYCERHMNRGRHRSRKHVEPQTCHSLPTIGPPKLTASSAVLRHTTTTHPATPNPATPSQDNRSVLEKANTVVPNPILSSSSSSIALKMNQHSTLEQQSEFGLVCSDSLLNPMHKTDPKSQNSLHYFMEDWSHSNQTPPSISISKGNNERFNLSPLRMGLGPANQVPVSWETAMGGPLAEVL